MEENSTTLTGTEEEQDSIKDVGREVIIVKGEGESEGESEYEIYLKYPEKEGVILSIPFAKVDKNGRMTLFYDSLNINDLSETERLMLANALRRLGYNEQNLSINKKTLEEITRDEQKQDTRRQESIRDEEFKEREQEGEEKVIAKRKGVPEGNVCKIDRHSKFFDNYRNIPRTSYAYLDEHDNMHMEYIDKDGTEKELEGFEEVKDRPTVVNIDNDGEDIKEEMPYRVMTAKGLEDQNGNVQDIRMAFYKDNGKLRLGYIEQGKNGKWEGKPIDTYGRDRNSHRVNKLIDETKSTKPVGRLAEQYEKVKESGYSSNGIQLDEAFKKIKIEEYIKDGYTEKEANEIYDYIVGEQHLEEDVAKEKVNAKRMQKRSEDEENDGDEDITPGGQAYARLEGHRR